MTEPRLTIAMPVYNAERYFEEAIESILAQTYKDFRFDIVDDGSTDNSKAIIERYAKQDSRIHLISRPNTGIIGALCDAVDASTCPLIARMDADDIAIPTRLEKQIAFMDANPDLVVSGTARTMIDEYGLIIDQHDAVVGHEAIDNALLTTTGGAIVHPTAIMRPDAYEKVAATAPRASTLRTSTSG